MICPQCAAENPPEARYCSRCGARLPAETQGQGVPRETIPPPADESRPLEAGQVLDGRFEIVRVLGQGPRGVVYLARDLDLQGREIAIKVFRPEITSDPDLDRALTRGVISWQGLIHPGVVKVYDLRRAGERRFLTEEYVPGKGLDRFLTERGEGRLSLPEACRVGIGILEVLAFAHPETPHLGLTPGNVLVEGEFPEIRVKLTDFAVAGRLEAVRAGGDESASEGAAADIQAIGAVLYELVTGQVPAVPATPPSQVIPGLPTGLDEVLARALDPDPAARFPDAARFRRALVTVAKEAIEAELSQRRQAEERRSRNARPEAEADRAVTDGRLDQALRRYEAVSSPDQPGSGETQERARRRLTRGGRRLGLAAGAALLVAAGVAGYILWRDYTTRQDIKQWTTQAAAAWRQGRFRAARALYLRLARVRPEDQALRRRLKASAAKIEELAQGTAPFIARARLARGQKRLGLARDQARLALKVDPHHPEALRLLAAVTADLKKIKAWLAAAASAWQKKNYQTAGRLYRQVIGLSSEHPVATRRLAQIPALIKARRARVNSLAARAGRALDQRDLTAAEKSYRSLLRLDPNLESARAALARIRRIREQMAGWVARIEKLWQDRKYAAARELFFRASALNAAPPPAPTRSRPAAADRRELRKKIAVALAAGRRALAARKWSAARGLFSRVLKLDPGNAEARQALTLIAARAKQVAAAQAQAKTALARGDLALVAAALRRFEKIDPSHPDAARLKAVLDSGIKSLLDRAQQALDQHRPDQARQLTERALRLRPKDPRGTALGERIKAIQAQVAALLTRIETAQNRKDWTGAGKLIKQAVALDSQNAGLDRLVRRGREVLARLRPLLEKARRAEAKGDLAAAREALRRAAALAPGDRAIAAARDRVKRRLDSRKAVGLKKTARLIKAEKWTQAEKAVRSVLKLDPASASAYAYLGTVRMEQEKFPAALADYDKALKLGLPPAKRAGVHYMRCFVLFRLARLRPAVKACSRAITLAPKRAVYYRARAAIYRRLGLRAAAARDQAAFRRLSRGR